MSIFGKTPLEQIIEGSHSTRHMNEFAKQTAIAFAKWLSGEGWQQYDEADRWICPTNNYNVITTSQLYDLYLQNKNK